MANQSDRELVAELVNDLKLTAALQGPVEQAIGGLGDHRPQAVHGKAGERLPVERAPPRVLGRVALVVPAAPAFDEGSALVDRVAELPAQQVAPDADDTRVPNPPLPR